MSKRADKRIGRVVITVVYSDGTIAHERFHRLSFGAPNENVSWIRGHHAADSKAVLALVAALALRSPR